MIIITKDIRKSNYNIDIEYKIWYNINSLQKANYRKFFTNAKGEYYYDVNWTEIRDNKKKL